MTNRNDIIEAIETRLVDVPRTLSTQSERAAFIDGALWERQAILAILKGRADPEPQAATGEIATGDWGGGESDLDTAVHIIRNLLARDTMPASAQAGAESVARHFVRDRQ